MMKGILTGLVMSAVPYVVAFSCDVTLAADETKVESKGHVVFVHSGDGGQAEPVVVTTSGGDGAVQWVAATADGGDGRSEGAMRHVVRVESASGGDADATQHGWLGVMISAKCAPGEDCDVKVTQVVDDSPAEAAGIMAGDIIVAVDGESVSGNVGQAVEMIKSRLPGDEVDIVVLRDGVEQTVYATLGTRKASATAQFHIDLHDDLLGQVEDKVITRGRMLTRDDEGNWVVTDLGDLNELADLPDHIKTFLPHSGHRVFELRGDGESRTLNIQITRDGETLTVKQDDGGEITVTRVDEQGDETVQVYDSAEELEAGDEEAYKLYSGHGTRGGVHFFGDGVFKVDTEFEFDEDSFPQIDGNAFFYSLDDLDEGAFEWRAQLEESLGDAQASYQEALEAAHEALKQLEEEGGLSGMAKLHAIRPLLHSEGQNTFAFRLGKPNYSFEVRADGQIAATLRKGDTEVVQLFADEDDMADRRPELYEKYRNVMDHE
jgi:hypothetical protein